MVHVRKGTERKEGDKGSIGASMKVEFRVSAQAGDLPMATHKKKGASQRLAPQQNSWQRPTLPHGHPSSTIGAGGLNCRVRNGIGCNTSAMVTRSLTSL